jgi:hypothetical protein
LNQERRDIENKFREAFQGFESPVSDSDWARISASLPPDQQIEQAFQTAFDDFEMPVTDSDWSRIAASIPQENKRRRALLWYSFAAFSLLGVYCLWWLLPVSKPVVTTIAGEAAVLKSSGTQKQAKPEHAEHVRQPSMEIGAPMASGGATAGTVKTNNTAASWVKSKYHQGGNDVRHIASQSPVQYSGGGFSGLQDSLHTQSWFMDAKKPGALRLHLFIPTAAQTITAGAYRPARVLWPRKPTPAIWISSGISGLSAAASCPQGAEWQGKTFNRTRMQSGLVQEIAVGFQVPIGSTSVQFGLGSTEPLTPLKQHWRIKTRMVTDSIPYMNMPGDTLFWIPVRFTDTLVDVVTTFSEKRWVIPFQMSQSLAISPKFGILFQAGGQIGILQSMKATIPSPYTDYTWSQLQQGMAGTVNTNKPSRSVDPSHSIRTRLDISAGTGFYYRINKQLTFRTSVHVAKGLGPLMKHGSPYQQLGGQFMLMYQW